jgi:hypothetical protein
MATSATSVTVTTLLPGGAPKGLSGGWIAITIPRAVLLFTPTELTLALKRGRRWIRQQQLDARHRPEEAR